jgi:sorting nexin-5/6/32
VIAWIAEYEQELNVRGKNKKEKLVDIFSSFQKTSDELLLSSTQKDIDEFFEAEKNFLVTYNQQLKAPLYFRIKCFFLAPRF